MSGVLQGSWGLGFALSALAYGLLYAPLEAWHPGYGWRGMLILGVLPALACVWIRIYVKEPEVWAENKKIQNATQKQVSLPLFAIFKRKYLFNTLDRLPVDGGEFLRLLRDLGHARAPTCRRSWAGRRPRWRSRSSGATSSPSSPALLGRGCRKRIGRRWALMLPTFISIFIAPLYLSTTDPTMFLILFMLMICFVGGKDALNPGWLSERFPTEVRATAAGFVYHQGAVWGAVVAPVLTYFAVNQGMGFAKPMLYGTVGSLIVYVIAVYPGAGNQGHGDDRRTGGLREGDSGLTFGADMVDSRDDRDTCPDCFGS